MGSARLVFGFGGHGQRRQRREGGGEQPPQLQGTVGSFYRFNFVIFNKFSFFMLVLAWKVDDGLGASRFWLWGPWTMSSTKRRRRRTAASAPRHSGEVLQIYFHHNQ